MVKRTNKLREEVSRFIVNWNDKFPIDYWWRTKYKIPFGSEQHRQSDFIKMFIDYEEEKMINEYINKSIKNKEEIEEGEFSELGEPSGKSMTKEEIDQAFDDIDLDKFNKK